MKPKLAVALVATTLSWACGLWAADPSRSAGGALAAARRAVSLDASGRDERTESLLAEGNALRRAGDDRAALTRFEEAWKRRPSARALAQMGLAEQALGRWL